MSSAKVVMLPVGDARTASTRYRLLAHLPALNAAGFETEIRYPQSLGRSGALRPVWRTLDLLRDVTSGARSPELLFIQRKTYPPLFASRLPRPDRPIVFDMDDALYLPPPGMLQDEQTVRRYHRNFAATAAAADLVLVGNHELSAALPHDRFECLPTPIDTDRFSPEAHSRATRPAAGWVGHSGNLPYLESLAEPLREISRRHDNFRLIVVADREPVLPGLDLEFRRWSLDDEVSCFADISVGLMPLDDTPWARGKCAFKAIQYMALGIPTVVSPVGANRELVTHGENGFLAATDAEWIEAVDALLSSHDLALGIGTAGRKTVLQSYSLNVISQRLINLLQSL